jgi:hypothetical protein
MDRVQVTCDQSALADFYNELEAGIDGIPAAFVDNVDESSCSEWADKPTEMIVLVPTDFEKDRIPVPVDRHSIWSTMVGSIVGDGSAMKGMVSVDRVTMENDLQLYRYDAEKVLMVSQSKAFMTTSLFMIWADQVFFPTIEDRRVRTDHQGPALLILDGCSSHHPVEFFDECKHRNIYILFLVPHNSHQCQPLDLVTFGLLKRCFVQFTFDLLPSSQSNKVIKMIGAWYQETARHQIIAPWLSMGLVPFRGDDNLICLRVDRGRAREVRGWGQDHPKMVPLAGDKFTCRERNRNSFQISPAPS